MMTGQNRLWVFGGAFAAVAVVVLSWLLLIGPQRGQTGTLHEQTEAARGDLIPLQHKLADLKARSEKLPEYKAALARSRLALPTEAGVSDFLRSLQTLGGTTRVGVQGLIVGVPAKITGVTPAVYAMPMTVSATGPVANLVKFVDQLQIVQPRAVLIGSVNFAPIGANANFDGSLTLTLAMQAFLAPPEAVDTGAGGSGSAGSKVTTGADAGGSTPTTSNPQTTPTARKTG
jgi:Tfp pilus assembly protein PilO